MVNITLNLITLLKKFSDKIILTLECPFSYFESPHLLGETVSYTVRGETSV